MCKAFTEGKSRRVGLGHPRDLIDNPGRGEKCEFSPAETVRYWERSGVEWVNSHLHDEHGGRHARVRAPVEVAAHLAFGDGKPENRPVRSAHAGTESLMLVEGQGMLNGRKLCAKVKP